MTEEKLQKPAVAKIRLVYPILFALFPMLSIYSANLAMISFETLLRPTLIISTISVVLWLIFGFGLRDHYRGAICSSVVISMCYFYTKFQSISHFFYIPARFEFWIWGLSTVGLASIFAWKFKWHKFANIFSIALVITTSLQICFSFFQAVQSSPEAPTSFNINLKAKSERPDILYVILDGYGRSDALKRSLGFDDTTFIKGLEKRGFFVANDSRANYCQTELSVGSSLNLDFIQTLLPKVNSKDSDRLPLGELVNHNAASRYLKAKGYTFCAITTGFPPLQFDSADVNLRSRSGMTMLESAILQISPWAHDGRIVDSQFVKRREDLTAAIEALSLLRTREIKPRFVVAHILAPHPPFVFGANGEMVPRKGLYGFWDGSDYLEHVSNASDYTSGYAGQAEYLGKKILSAIDSILSSDGEKPVILIQGDHGSKLRLDQNSLANTDLNECFPNLSAFYVPDSVRKNLYPSISAVNSFRVVFNGLFSDNFQLRPDLSWYSTYPRPFEFTEVTNQIADSATLKSIPLPKQ